MFRRRDALGRRQRRSCFHRPTGDFDGEPVDDAAEQGLVGILETPAEIATLVFPERIRGEFDRDFPTLADIAHVGLVFVAHLGIGLARTHEGGCLLAQFTKHRAGAPERGIKAHVGRARRLEAERRLEEADGRTNSRSGGHQQPIDAEFFAQPAGMDRSSPAKGDHGIA